MADSPHAQTLIATVAAFGARIAALIERALASVLRRRDRRKLRSEVNGHISDFRVRVRPLAELVIREAHTNGNGDARGRIGHLPETQPISAINRQSIAVLVDNLTSSLDGAAVQIGRRADDVFRREGLRQALGQITDELPESEAAAQLRDRLVREGMSTFRDRSGRHWDLERYARMVVRTTTAEAHAQGVVAQMLSRGFDLVEVIGEGNCPHHPKNPDHPCRAYPGKVFSLTGATEGYPKLPSTPPWHPACRHSLLPAVEGVTALLDREREAVAA